MKKEYLTIFVVMAAVVIFGSIFLLRGFNGEDSWIKDSRGVWVKHGNPSQTPDKIEEQHNALSCAMELFTKARNSMMILNSQCLGRCLSYSVDIVHVPREQEDNQQENQCADFRIGTTPHFIELDKFGNIVKVYDD